MGRGFFIYSRTPSAVLELLVPCHLPALSGTVDLAEQLERGTRVHADPDASPSCHKASHGAGALIQDLWQGYTITFKVISVTDKGHSQLLNSTGCIKFLFFFPKMQIT